MKPNKLIIVKVPKVNDRILFMEKINAAACIPTYSNVSDLYRSNGFLYRADG